MKLGVRERQSRTSALHTTGWMKMQGMENSTNRKWKEPTEGVQYNRGGRHGNTDKVSK